MTPTDSERLHELLDGTLPASDEAALMRRIALDARLAQEHRELRALWGVLRTSLDVDPPKELETRVLAAIRRDRAERRALPVPAWLEHVLVVTGAAGLAGLITIGRLTGPSTPEAIGNVVVETTRGFGILKTAAVDLAQWDWTLRLFATLARASATAIESSASPLTGVTILALAISTSVAAALWRRQRSLGLGGVSNVLA